MNASSDVYCVVESSAGFCVEPVVTEALVRCPEEGRIVPVNFCAAHESSTRFKCMTHLTVLDILYSMPRTL